VVHLHTYKFCHPHHYFLAVKKSGNLLTSFSNICTKRACARTRTHTHTPIQKYVQIFSACCRNKLCCYQLATLKLMSQCLNTLLKAIFGSVHQLHVDSECGCTMSICTGIPFVPTFPRFYRSLSWCPDKFGSGCQMSQFFSGHEIHF
jgi:hypothetical protein